MLSPDNSKTSCMPREIEMETKMANARYLFWYLATFGQFALALIAADHAASNASQAADLPLNDSEKNAISLGSVRKPGILPITLHDDMEVDNVHTTRAHG